MSTLARMAYEAYQSRAIRTTPAGTIRTPEFDALHDTVRATWEHVAAVVVARMFGDIRRAMTAAGQALAEANQELREACQTPRADAQHWGAEYPTEAAIYQQRQTAAMALLDAVASLDAAQAPAQEDNDAHP